MKRVGTNSGRNARMWMPHFFTIVDVANFLDVSTRTVRRWIRRKLLVAHHINGVVRIS